MTDRICREPEQRAKLDFEFPGFLEGEKVMLLVRLDNRRRTRGSYFLLIL